MKPKKTTPTKRTRTDHLSQFALMGIPGVDPKLTGMNDVGDDDEDDEALEDELMNILGMNKQPAKPPPRRSQPGPSAMANLDAMVAASLKDDVSDDDGSDDDDPGLLDELNSFIGVAPVAKAPSPIPPPSAGSGGVQILSLLQERLSMYKEAETQATFAGDSIKARRCGRGIKVLEDLIRKAQKGATINEEEIPLPVSVKKAGGGNNDQMLKDKPSPPIRPAPSIPEPSEDAQPKPPVVPPRSGVPLPGLTPSAPPLIDLTPPEQPDPPTPKVDQQLLETLTTRRDAYKKAALMAKRSGDTTTALQYVKVIKQFEAVIVGVSAGHPLDMNSIPPMPPGFDDSGHTPPPPSPAPVAAPLPTIPPQEESPKEDSSPSEPLTILSALESRLAKFKEQEESAKKDNNASKVRRMGRIVKQYEDAIRLHKAGKKFNADELPTPPGFPPIPVESGPAPAQPAAPSSPQVPGPLSTSASSLPSPDMPSTSSKAPSPLPPRNNQSPAAGSSAPPQRKSSTRQEKQMEILLSRQAEFKQAALNSKKQGDIELAKEYLKQAKRFDPLIEASKNGLPIDMATLPVKPGAATKKAESGFEIIDAEDCVAGSFEEIYPRLINDLQKQLKMCTETRDHFKTIGDIANANRFDNLAANTKKDLDTIVIARKRADPVPKFHYEKRSFSIVKCNTDLNDNDVELSIINGINYNVPNPKEVDTYVRFEFPYPTDDPKKDKTSTVYNTNNPKYDAVFMVPIQRNVRSCQRIFKRQGIKLEVWSKGGFLRSDTLIGTANVKLLPLETKCTIHDSFDLMEGRKTVGGKLEVKVRVRHPIQSKEVETIEEKWLLLG